MIMTSSVWDLRATLWAQRLDALMNRVPREGYGQVSERAASTAISRRPAAESSVVRSSERLSDPRHGQFLGRLAVAKPAARDPKGALLVAGGDQQDSSLVSRATSGLDSCRPNRQKLPCSTVWDMPAFQQVGFNHSCTQLMPLRPPGTDLPRAEAREKDLLVASCYQERSLRPGTSRGR
jgi:hypothetical protein